MQDGSKIKAGLADDRKKNKHTLERYKFFVGAATLPGMWHSRNNFLHPSTSVAVLFSAIIQALNIFDIKQFGLTTY